MQVIRPSSLKDNGGSFARASVGSYFDSEGALQSANVDTPRVTYDPDTLECVGLLLEDAATNLLLHSSTVATQTITVVAGQPWTLSFYGTGTVTLSGATSAAVVGLGANQRKVYTFTPTTTSLVVTPSGSVLMGQVEDGAATSYIPTTTVPVTRSADVATGTGVLYIGGLTETDFPAWNAATTYVIGDQVIRTTSATHGIYKCAVAGVNATPPEQTVADAVPRWVFIGPTNKWAAFDGGVGTQTKKSGEPLIILIRPGITDSLAMLNTLAAKVNVSLVNAGAIIKNYNIITDDPSDVTDWFPYFFSSPKARTELVITQMPPYVDGVLALTFEGATIPADTAVGMIVAGTLLDIGLDQYGIKVGIQDLSRVTTDEFGQTTIIKRGYLSTVDATCELKNQQVDSVVKALRELGSVPAVWIGANAIYDVLTVYGLGSFSVDLTYFDTSFCTLGIKGLI